MWANRVGGWQEWNAVSAMDAVVLKKYVYSIGSGGGGVWWARMGRYDAK